DRHQLIATRVAVYQRHALALQAERAPALRARRHLHGLFAIERRYLNLRAHRRIGEAHRQLEEDVAALPLEEFVRLDIERDEQVARRTTTRGPLTFARHPDRDAVVHSGGD